MLCLDRFHLWLAGIMTVVRQFAWLLSHTKCRTNENIDSQRWSLTAAVRAAVWWRSGAAVGTMASGKAPRWWPSSPWPSWRSPPSSPEGLYSHPQCHADAPALWTGQWSGIKRDSFSCSQCVQTYQAEHIMNKSLNENLTNTWMKKDFR